MLLHLSLDKFLALAQTASRVAIYREIAIDGLTPIEVVDKLEQEMCDGALLESGLCHQKEGRYSFITFGSIASLSVCNQVVSQRIGEEVTSFVAEPFAMLRQLSKKLACATMPHAIDFIHGAVGFITYDAVRLFESIPDKHAAENALPQLQFNFYQTTLVFDHLQQKLLISRIVDVNDNPEKIYQDTQETIAALITKITAPSKKSQPTSAMEIDNEVRTDLSDEQFMQLVLRAQQYIVDGDAFQIVLSRCFTRRYSLAPLDIYRALCKISPAPYMFYLPIENGILIGASPEKLISVLNRQVEITPIAGTRQRTDKTNDEQITKELLADHKEHAEHMMLVDLARNDLGAVCEPGSVNVKELLQVKHFSHVSHITSLVTGQLRADHDAFDALAAAFPAGTLSGAPKIRAMQIIDELETSRRGMYGGAICRFDFKGNFDSCIAIRMASLSNGIATVRTGAGVVYDSNPAAEANETRQKAKGVLDAIAHAQAGLL